MKFLSAMVTNHSRVYDLKKFAAAYLTIGNLIRIAMAANAFHFTSSRD
jgi:hypothetical protein